MYRYAFMYFVPAYKSFSFLLKNDKKSMSSMLQYWYYPLLLGHLGCLLL